MVRLPQTETKPFKTTDKFQEGPYNSNTHGRYENKLKT
jgi:hypothetical protein